MGTVEVETAESVNHLEAMAQWAHLGRARAPFHLYVPPGWVDIARRLAAENSVNVAEIWSYHTIGDQTRFTLVHRAPASETRKAQEPRRPAAPPRGARSGGGVQSRVASRGRQAEGRPPRSAAKTSRTKRSAAPKAASSRTPEKEVNPADAAFHPRQAWVREHLRRPQSPAAAPGPASHSLLVSHAARGPGRAGGPRRGRDPPDRRAPPADPLRLAADPQRRGRACAAGAGPDGQSRPKEPEPAAPPASPRPAPAPMPPPDARANRSARLMRASDPKALPGFGPGMRTSPPRSPAGPGRRRRQQLHELAERLNPDSWVTDDEVQRGLEEYESVLASLRDVVGRRRRRKRSRSAGPSTGKPDRCRPSPAKKTASPTAIGRFRTSLTAVPTWPRRRRRRPGQRGL